MIKLQIFNSGEKYNYKTKKEALRDVKGNGLKSYEYYLEDSENNTIYKSGLWLNEEEYKMLEDGFTIKQVKILRRINRRTK